MSSSRATAPEIGKPLEQEAVAQLFKKIWRPGFMSASADELMFLQNIIQEKRPQTIVEIGVASGITTGFLAHFLAAVNGKRVIGIDFNDNFFNDPARPIGYMASQVYTDKAVGIDIHVHKTSLDMGSIVGALRPEVVFIDANHQHPWPTLDMIATVPFVAPKAVIAHHDLLLFRRQKKILGIGPKYLFDQIPPQLRSAPPQFGGNIFSIQVPEKPHILAAPLGTALQLPWTAKEKLSPDMLARLRKIIEEKWKSPQLLRDLDRAVGIFN